MNLILAAVVGGFGAYLVLRARHLYLRSQASRDWPVAQGKLSRCTLREERVHTRHGTHSSWNVDITYKFDVDGKRFTGQRRVWSEQAFPNKFAAQLAVRGLKRKPTRVLYDPEDPNESILYPGHAGNLAGTLWIGVGLLTVAVLFATL